LGGGGGDEGPSSRHVVEKKIRGGHGRSPLQKERAGEVSELKKKRTGGELKKQETKKILKGGGVGGIPFGRGGG